ncbi:MAG: hypothetical protein JOZ71_09165 [Ktedonobacteraceae bacterium]|nr:hypothetical protein [Ktedonobacteraceae bacterium]
MVEEQGPAHKPTLYDLRVKHGGGNIGNLAQVSGIDDRHVYTMLLNRGVTHPDAERILTAFNHINQTSYALDELEVHLVDDYQEQPSASADSRTDVWAGV